MRPPRPVCGTSARLYIPTPPRPHCTIDVGQLLAFVHRIAPGDLVALPRKTTSTIALGRVTGPYQFRDDLREVRHVRPATWVRTDSPRTDVAQDLLYSLGAFMMVCQITRNRAEQRFQQLLNGRSDPALSEARSRPGPMPPLSAETIVRLVHELGADPDALLLLAGKMPQDLVPIITRSPAWPAFLRAVRDLTDGELCALAVHAQKIRGGRPHRRGRQGHEAEDS